MKKTVSLIKEHIATNILDEFENVFNKFNDDDMVMVMIDKISRLKTREISSVVNVSEDMARKYKSGYSLPTLENAVLLEECFSIPAKYWVLYRNQMKSSKVA